MIELIDFGKDYGDFRAVEALNLKIGAGEMFGFIGPNGAGKSTTIRFLATLLKASRGEGIVNGYSVTQNPMAVRQSVGYMPDNFGVYDGMKVWEFLDFFAVAYKIGKGKRKQVINDVLELLDLAHKRDDYVNGLSRGMKQRLCMAKTLVHDPPVLILDEPTSGLDPLMERAFRVAVGEARDAGQTVFVSSHRLAEVEAICDRVGILRAGELVEVAGLDQLRRLRRVEIDVRFAGDDLGLDAVLQLPGVAEARQVSDRHLVLQLAGGAGLGPVLRRLADADPVALGVREPSLEEIFLEYYGDHT
jgi:ABC-2 type transport system ATP-binding protein